jgi:hypothetical protein
MSKIRPDQVVKELKKRASEASQAAAKQFSLKDFCFDKQLAFIEDPARFKTAVCSRRCLAEGTLVQTTAGPKPIEQVKVGDYVYDEHGNPIQVVKTFYNGPKQVVELIHNRRTIAETTLDHVFLTTNTYKNTVAEVAIKDFNSRTKIVRKEVLRSHGINVPTAYALGALLGDGCSLQTSKNRLYMSSSTVAVPAKVAKLLDTKTKKLPSKNYTWVFQTGTGPAFYNDWCNGKYAHQKTTDIEEVLTWDRESRLAFFAGLLDTDGSVTNCHDGLIISISMQAKSVIEAAQILFLDLWGYLPSLHCDNRKKYKNGPVWEIKIKHNYFSVKALQELDPHLVSPQKKFKPEYLLKVQNNYRPDQVGIKLGKTSFKKTYDIHVNSATNLYMLANGLVTHNSGKTIACAADLIFTAMSKPGDVAYITLSRRNAKRIIWRELLKINKDYNLGGKPDGTELTITMPTGSVIHVSGAKDEAEIERFRGMALRKVYIDEVQSFRNYIQELIEDVIEPALTDYYGNLVLIGTPGPIPAGFFYDISHSKGWSHHHWTMQDNPFIRLKSGKDPIEIIRELAERRNLSLNSPSIQREYFGQWVKDVDSLVYHFDTAKNIYVDLPNDMRFVFGIDIGYKDADAIAVLGYSESQRKVFVVEEYIRAKNDITSLVEQIKQLQQKYDPVKMVMDAGALGRKIQEEIRMRHSLTVEAAEKARKLEYIALLNDDLRTGKLQFAANSRFEEDSYLVQWDYSNPERPVISRNYHTDIGDAVLYAWRECKHFYEQDVKPPKPTVDQYMQQLEEKEAEAMEMQKQGGNQFTDVNNWNDLFIGDDYDDDIF